MAPSQRPSARDRLLRAAESVLFSRGIRATPVDDLLREADVSAATLYAQFGSKDGLLAEALRRRLAGWQTIWDRHVVEAGDDTARLLALFDALEAYRVGTHPPARWCAFLTTATEFPDPDGPVGEVLAADSELLDRRLLHLSRPLAGDHAQELADEVALAYDGTLAAFLRGRPASAIDVGRRLARAAISAHRA
ncbi:MULTISPECIES: TetR/AcrR family transcriptional regulator [unclassified Brachybacterium]|uniref:TetR/AcrR family transcriptional regulator n=1 Tax=unclassified Brachybacterium TaxID=2623841 RepID=UPI003618FFC9